MAEVLEFMIAQFLRGYNGGFTFEEVMNLDSKLFFTYHEALTRVNRFENGEELPEIEEELGPDVEKLKQLAAE